MASSPVVNVGGGLAVRTHTLPIPMISSHRDHSLPLGYVQPEGARCSGRCVIPGLITYLITITTDIGLQFGTPWP